MNKSLSATLGMLVGEHLQRIYPDQNSSKLSSKLLGVMDLDGNSDVVRQPSNKWSEQDCWVISYGNSVVSSEQNPLQTLHLFAKNYLATSVNGLHILPFFPYSSDDGFSVIDYSQVNESLGGWPDIEALAEDFDLMADLVINHCSSRSRWFENYKNNKEPGKGYFVEASPNDDLSKVVRPRTSPLLREVNAIDGERHVWCTFGHDQIDLDFSNPEVLCEMVQIIRRYLDQGIRIFRLDAVAFIWKELGTDCLHLPQTHELVRLLRTLIEAYSPNAIIITETNVPNHENLSYFGNANEAHAVYNFSLPPLLLHALVTGNSEHLKQWQMSMPPAQTGTFYFNFVASHDGIGLRPVSGLLEQEEIDQLVNAMQSFGGRISWRTVEGGLNEPYEINIALFDAMQGTVNGPDKWQIQRFICAHAIMLALEGVPGIYIHSLIATNNDYDRIALTNNNRSINRHRWQYDSLIEKLNDESTHHYKVFERLTSLIALRSKQAAFHPNAVQYTLHLGDQVFAFWRQSINRDQSIFCIHNISDQQVVIPLSSINLISLDEWRDLASDTVYEDSEADIILAPYDFVWISNKQD
ncbi:MAG: hypothetical protein KTR16_11040 [Acidiferrobacterales bacterium]|nr:hypothetical protein [Acidiferrobacterales bacterium]